MKVIFATALALVLFVSTIFMIFILLRRNRRTTKIMVKVVVVLLFVVFTVNCVNTAVSYNKHSEEFEEFIAKYGNNDHKKFGINVITSPLVIIDYINLLEDDSKLYQSTGVPPAYIEDKNMFSLVVSETYYKLNNNVGELLLMEENAKLVIDYATNVTSNYLNTVRLLALFVLFIIACSFAINMEKDYKSPIRDKDWVK